MIELVNLSKDKGRRRVVDGVDLRLDGGITALLGPNGAGKTTVMRLVAGLDQPTAGKALVDGRPIAAWGTSSGRLGCLIDSPAVHPRWTAGRQLSYLGTSQGLSPDEISEVAAECGVAAFARVPGKALSLGMRQRLGVAMALLGRPRTLVLDEPTNGLDPQALRWLRGVVRGHAAAGNTVVICSHLMSEVQDIADDLAILRLGRLAVHQGLASFVTEMAAPRIRVVSDQLDELDHWLVRAGALTARRDGALLVQGLSAREVGSLALDRRVAVSELGVEHACLEDVYLDFVSEQDPAQHPSSPTTQLPGREDDVHAQHQDATSLVA